MKVTRMLAALALAAALCGAPAQAQQTQPIAIEYGSWTPAFALAQQRALARQLDALKPAKEGKHNVYVLSVALYGQHVFESEATGAANALAQHFHAEGRVVVLSNYHPNPEPTYAAATGTHIETAIGRIAEMMDKENDVLVLFMTSHGAQNGGIVGFEPMLGSADRPMRQAAILPGRLRGALDSSGIKNRIIILSSCFSGQFIPTLQDASTVVLTAASADRTSFGCQAENDWTYFGDAMFNGTLQNSSTLLGAFDAAKKKIVQEETSGNLIPSQPQMYVGPLAQQVLNELETEKKGGFSLLHRGN